MNAEMIELRLTRSGPPRRRPAVDPRVIDEAFASVSDADLRRDADHQAERHFGPDVTALLREQLAALESQRRKLMRLLEA